MTADREHLRVLEDRILGDIADLAADVTALKAEVAALNTGIKQLLLWLGSNFEPQPPLNRHQRRSAATRSGAP
jgi:hypothetical protein